MNTKKIVKFGDICQEVKLTTKDPISDGFEYYIGLEHLDSNSLTIKRWGIIRDDNPSFTRVFKKGHILFGKRRSYLKKAAIAKFDGICSSDIIVMEPIGDIVLHELVPYIIQSEPFWDFAIRTSSGSLSPRTKWKDLATYTFNISEQQGHLLKLFQTMEKTLVASNNLLDACQQKKKVLMQNLLTGKDRLLDENGIRYYNNWEQKFLGDISNITTGSSNRVDSNVSGLYAFFDRSNDVRFSNTFLFDCEAIIIPGEGQNFIPRYFKGKFDLHQRTYAIMDFKECDGMFLYYLIDFYSSYFLSVAVGSTVKSLRLPMFKKMKLKLPSMLEQKKIVSLLLQADEEIAIIQNKIKSLENIKRNILLTSFNK